MVLEIIVSAVNMQDFSDILSKTRHFSKNTKLLIINQTRQKKSGLKEEALFLDSKNIRVLSFNEIGLSKSRNQGIKNATGDICLISDSDVEFKNNLETIITDAFANNPEADIITFQIETPDHKKFKKYPKKEKWHNIFSIMKVSSIEIAFRRKAIQENNLLFDENFGLNGNIFPFGGEENIFLYDCLKKGLKIKYIPKPIVIHKKESTGKKLDYETLFTKGALFARIFNHYCWIVNILFIIKKIPELKPLNLCKALKQMFSGSKKWFEFVEKGDEI
ncbi:glycosyltransferase family 2 protein [Kosmotoga sp. DU53]|uniref:glycosyltransferase family 2 protein n=1 Tax=Kosmotoga sp. DU53 TaxID=1310160 RepID=UPI0007C52C05|nr:glycosyltransferase family 2 protein [Kosmotoga sp. DU53]